MEPITRKEMFLAKAGGQDVTTPTPVTREEIFLNEIAKGGGGSGGGVLVVHDVGGTLDKTWQEIHDAFVSSDVRIQNGTDTNTLVIVRGVQYHSKSGEYRVEPAVAGSWQPATYIASSADGYPVL